ncbi:MAG: DUF2207 domain-containing protein [Patescibacteria group bacterium]
MKKYFLIFALLILFLWPGGVFAQEKSWFFDKWDVDITINKDSTFLVQEAQTFNFTGNYHWVTRTLVKTKGIRYDDIKVLETDGTRLSGSQVEITDGNTNTTIKVNFDLTDTTHTWIFEYTVIGGLGFFDDHDELYWNVVSSDRDVEIKEAQAKVHLPEAVAVEDLQQKIFLGYTGSNEESQNYTASPGQMNFSSQNILPYYNFTIVAGWPKGVVESPGLIQIESTPSGAEIFLDGESRSLTTPTSLLIGYDLKEGNHALNMTKFGYQDCQKTLEAKKGEDQTINCELTQKAWYKIGWIIFKILAGLYFISPIFVFIFLYKRWKKFGRDPKAKGTVIAQYEPPDNIRPGEMGVLIDEKADLRDITASIIDLAYRGYIKIYEDEEKGFLSKQKKYRFEKLKDFSADSGLKGYEKLLLGGLFEKGNMVSLDDLKNEFYKTLKEIKAYLYEETTALGYFEANPEKVRAKYIIIGIILMAIGWVLLFVPMVWGLLVFIFGFYMPKKTFKGAEARWWAAGFSLYLYTAERFRLGQVTPETFEKYLSYAMVFQVETQWAERFKDIYKQAPDWFVSSAGVRAFVIADFASNLTSGFSTAVSAGLASSPSSSSGFGGGGFGGGGGGGGGSGAG